MKRLGALLMAALLLLPFSAGATEGIPGFSSWTPDLPEPTSVPPDGRHFDGGYMNTTVYLDGTFDRIIGFTNMYERDAAMRKEYGPDLEEQLRERVQSVGGELTYIGNPAADSALASVPISSYLFSLRNGTAEQVGRFTELVLGSEDVSFFLSLSPAQETLGAVALCLHETHDISGCLDGGAALTVDTYVEWTDRRNGEEATDAFLVDSYTVKGWEEHELNFTLTVPYSRVTVSPRAESERAATVTLTFFPAEGAAPFYRVTAFNSLQDAARDRAVIREEEKGISLVFSGTPEEITRDLKEFVGAYLPRDPGEVPVGIKTYYAKHYHFLTKYYASGSEMTQLKPVLPDYAEMDTEVGEISFTLAPMETADRFKTGLAGRLALDLRPVVGMTALVPEGGDGIRLVPEGETVQREDQLFNDTKLLVRFTLLQEERGPLAYLIPGGLLLLAAAVLFLLRFRVLFPKRPVPETPETAAGGPEGAEPPEEEAPVTFRVPRIYIAGGEEDEP